jgi:hypothetical protein
MSFTVPLPPRTQLYHRSYSNKHTHPGRLSSASAPGVCERACVRARGHTIEVARVHTQWVCLTLSLTLSLTLTLSLSLSLSRSLSRTHAHTNIRRRKTYRTREKGLPSLTSPLLTMSSQRRMTLSRSPPPSLPPSLPPFLPPYPPICLSSRASALLRWSHAR